MHYIVAIGCPDIVPKQEASVKRVGNKAVVKCNHTDITYYLSCEGTQWIGDIGNCTKGSELIRVKILYIYNSLIFPFIFHVSFHAIELSSH